ncbi:hypothetical protein BDY21DRAFT_83089 [Lineolata rhizophorae]|uniref:Kelch repeat protein n=1 Tax=Lineolata rhizophorae TaxID=578093 RepID=A0A6A6PBH1_9PEZI|nr:hypothetical protein BDY21DRAFT_83089 [Lineolata rhizophorae]
MALRAAGVALTALSFAAPSLQQKDPLTDFCRRFGHQTTVIDRRLYIDGGMVNWNPISQNPLNYTNKDLLWQDLNDTHEGMPQLHTGLTKNASVPDVSGGVLWADEVNKVFYLYGGEVTESPEDFALWAYDAVLDQWNVTGAPRDIQRVAWGAGAAVNERAEGYYLGGWLGDMSVPGWEGSPRMTSNLVRYDMETEAWTNNTGPDGAGRAEGVMLFLPASDNGLLISFGGVMDPDNNGTVVGDPMDNIHVYDIQSGKWYLQQATGDVPDMRRKFCAGATWAQDRSSYNIYLYGGQGINNITGFDDVYILTMPSFKWIKWFPTEPGPGNPHGLTTCNVISNSQMIIIGGYFAQHDECDSPTIWGTHNLNLGANGPQNAPWDLYYPNITEYFVPQEILDEIGGSPTGGATTTSPVEAWGHRDLPVRTRSFATKP